MKHLNCFIASAFGREDVDQTYDKVIVPLLKRHMKIQFLRVDRVIHNDDITSKIVELMHRSDFGIIDLTYARPSVYYEAGFMEGQKKPVIYIVREDHFNRKALDDSAYNYFVHFDLSVKNIIAWRDIDTQLLPRITLITEPIIKRLQHGNLEEKSRLDFESLPLGDRLQVIEELVGKHIRSLGFLKHHRDPDLYYNNKGVFIMVTTEVSITQNIIFNSSYTIRYYMEKEGLKGSRVLIFCCINPVPKARIEKALRFFSKTEDNIYRHQNTYAVFMQSMTSRYKIEQLIKTLEIPC